MAKQPTPKIKERVKVQILPSSDAKESVELDYRMFVTGNFSHQEPGAHKDGDGTLKDRRVREIKNKRDFIFGNTSARICDRYNCLFPFLVVTHR